MGGSYQQEVDLLSLFKDVCSEYVQMCTVPQQLPEPDRPGDPHRAGQRARRRASSSPPTCMELEYEPPGHAFKRCRPAWGSTGRTSVARRRARVRQAADILNAG